MTSLEFFKYDDSQKYGKPGIDWGTGEQRNVKLDPTVIQAPTYLLK